MIRGTSKMPESKFTSQQYFHLYIQIQQHLLFISIQKQTFIETYTYIHTDPKMDEYLPPP